MIHYDVRTSVDSKCALFSLYIRELHYSIWKESLASFGNLPSSKTQVPLWRGCKTGALLADRVEKHHSSIQTQRLLNDYLWKQHLILE